MEEQNKKHEENDNPGEQQENNDSGLNNKRVPYDIERQKFLGKDEKSAFSLFIELLIGLGIGILIQFLGTIFAMHTPAIMIAILFYLIAIVFSFATGRKGVGVGLILSIFVPVGIMGGCLFWVAM